MRAREESNLQPPGPQPGVLSIELRALITAILAYKDYAGKLIAVLFFFEGKCFS